MTNHLRAFRARHVLTQREAAEAVGVGLSTWRQIEEGFRGRRPPRALLAHLAALDLLAEIAGTAPWDRGKIEVAWPKPPRTDDAEDD